MAKEDVKNLVIAGCQVRLAFHALDRGRWNVEAKVQCGIDENVEERSFQTANRDSREAAEKEALQCVADFLGHNVDRNTSRVKNWS